MRARSRQIKNREIRRDRIGKREVNRRLTSLGLSRHDDDDVQREALAIIERFRLWTRAKRCVASGARTGETLQRNGYAWSVVVEPAHIDARGSWNPDLGNVLPLVDFLHRESHQIPDFWTKRGIEPVELARAHAIEFLREHPKDRDWLLEHAVDGDVLALCQAVEGES